MVSRREMGGGREVQYTVSKNGGRLAYHKVSGTTPNVLYIPGLNIQCIEDSFNYSSSFPGFMSGKDGEKAEHLKSHCTRLGRTFVRYDPTCMGDSEGSMEKVQFKDWVDDAAMVLVEQCEGPTVLVGSSMGGWISLLLATRSEFKHLVKGLVLVAPALNFFRPYYQQMVKELPLEQQEKLERGEMVAVEDEYGITYLRKSFADASADLELDLSKPLEVSLPCRILHGARDATIPCKNSVGLMENLAGNNVELVVRKEAEHRFSEPKSLQVLTESLEGVMRDIEQGQQ